MPDLTKHAELLMGLIFIASLTLILTALGFQYIGELAPCDLCYKQRWAYYSAIALIPLALFFYGRDFKSFSRYVLIGMAVVFFLNTLLGIYHSGVEWKLWAGPTGCAGTGDLSATIDLLGELEKVKIVPCDKVQWSLLGISMAGYSALASLGLGLLSLGTAFKAFSK